MWLSYAKRLQDAIQKVVVTTAAGETVPPDDALNRAVETVIDLATRGGKIVYIGNGGSAGIASHLSVDAWKNGGVPAVAFNDASLLTCIANDFGYGHVFEKPVEMFASKGDLLIAISSSGKSENILRGVEAARGKSCRVITLSGFGADNPLRTRGDLNFYVPHNDYGPVEIVHLTIGHAMVDGVIARRKKA